MAITLSGCAASNQATEAQLNAPVSLTDPIVYGDLVGHYGRPLPQALEPLHMECVYRGNDVIMLIKAIKLKNHELQGLRDLSGPKLP